jgi:5-formyltetrahydrofolate cyclo-ligase
MNKKKLIRDYILDELAKIEDFSKKDERIFKNFFANYEDIIPQGCLVAAYIPSGNEYNILPLLKDLESRGHKIAVAFMENSENIEFCYWSDGDELENSKIFPKIKEPKNKVIAKDPKVVIVPLVGCDIKCNRVGRGKGIYDKKIEQLQKMKLNIIFMAICYEEQILAEVPVEPHDKKLDYIVTEKKIFKFLLN